MSRAFRYDRAAREIEVRDHDNDLTFRLPLQEAVGFISALSITIEGALCLDDHPDRDYEPGGAA